MFFPPLTPSENILNWCKMQLPAIIASAKNGIDIEIKAHKKQRSYQQNRYLMAVM